MLVGVDAVLPWLLMFFHVQVEPRQRATARVDRAEIHLFASVGDAATYQSYHAWATFIRGRRHDVIFVHVVPERRQRCAVWPAAPKA